MTTTIAHWGTTGAGTLGSPLIETFRGQVEPLRATDSDLRDAIADESVTREAREAAAQEFLRRNAGWYEDYNPRAGEVCKAARVLLGGVAVG